MKFNKSDFIELALSAKVLQFGQFTLKSGRQSPYFFNAGLFHHGQALRLLGQFYAKTLLDSQVEFDQLFGPAYKGLPLATTTAVALAELGKDVAVTFNRKEVKDHGEGGQLIGAPLVGKTVMIDDVITAGTAFRESQALIKAHGGKLQAVIIALDRCERGQGQQSTLEEIRQQGIAVHSIITLHDLIEYLEEKGNQEQVRLLRAYQKEYGIG